jgi:hypothetical protein
MRAKDTTKGMLARAGTERVGRIAALTTGKKPGMLDGPPPTTSVVVDTVASLDGHRVRCRVGVKTRATYVVVSTSVAPL